MLTYRSGGVRSLFSCRALELDAIKSSSARVGTHELDYGAVR